MPNRKSEHLSRREREVLWHLKKHGPYYHRTHEDGRLTNSSILNELGKAVDIPVGSLRGVLSTLEAKSLVLREYQHGKKNSFANQGHNPCIRISLVDPNMELEPLAPIPLAVVLKNETGELAERNAHEPTDQDVILALLARNDELQAQIDKLVKTVIELEGRHQRENRPRPAPLTDRIKGALTDDQWEALRHQS